jgi:hypothetical protein
MPVRLPLPLAGHPLHEQARQLLDQHNPNENKNSNSGLQGTARRHGGSPSRAAWHKCRPSILLACPTRRTFC